MPGRADRPPPWPPPPPPAGVTKARHGQRRLRSALVGAGAIDAVTGLTSDELFEWWSGTFEMLLGPQPFTMTPELAAEGIRREFSPVGPSASVVRSFSEPPGWVFLSRIDSG